MNHNSKNDQSLPIGDKPFWDLNCSEEEQGRLKSISESCVLLQSLKQSRDRWLFKTFPKFSSKSRANKTADVTPPPHTIQNRGICDLEIGPHVFPDTVFYEVQYLSPQVSCSTTLPNQNANPNPYWQSSVPYSSTYACAAPAPAPSPSRTPQATTTAQADSEKVSTPLISSLTSVATITPGLINQVNTAASTNPILANLLQLAAAGRASADQLKTLGLLIQSLANLETPSPSSLPTSVSQHPFPVPSTPSHVGYYQRMPSVPPVKEFDLVLEFRETPNDRWLFPRGRVYAERKYASNAINAVQNISLLTCVPFNNTTTPASQQNETDSTPATNPQYPVTLTIRDAPSAIWDTILRWTGGEDIMKANKTHIESLVLPPRLFLGYQLPPGPSITQLQLACGPTYTMKTLKQGPTTQHRAPRQKRTYTQRKGTESKTAQVKPANTPGDSIVVKRPRMSQSRSSSAVPIQCLSCKQTDVPLILGGRFCRPCAEKQTSTVVQPTSFLVQGPASSSS